MADEFKRDLSEQQLTDLIHAGGKMAASMRQVLALSSERMANGSCTSPDTTSMASKIAGLR